MIPGGPTKAKALVKYASVDQELKCDYQRRSDTVVVHHHKRCQLTRRSASGRLEGVREIKVFGVWEEYRRKAEI